MKKIIKKHPISLASFVFFAILSIITHSGYGLLFGVVSYGPIFLLEWFYGLPSCKSTTLYDTTNQAVRDALKRRSMEE